MLSDVTYPLIAGTHVPGDFVEFPSQIYENWIEQPEMLRRFALHYKTGEPMPEALLEKLLSARRFNQGFATVEYTASARKGLSRMGPARRERRQDRQSRHRRRNGALEGRARAPHGL